MHMKKLRRERDFESSIHIISAHRYRPSSQEILQGDTEGAIRWGQGRGGEGRGASKRGGAAVPASEEGELFFTKLQTRLANVFAELVQNSRTTADHRPPPGRHNHLAVTPRTRKRTRQEGEMVTCDVLLPLSPGASMHLLEWRKVRVFASNCLRKNKETIAGTPTFV